MIAVCTHGDTLGGLHLFKTGIRLLSQCLFQCRCSERIHFNYIDTHLKITYWSQSVDLIMAKLPGPVNPRAQNWLNLSDQSMNYYQLISMLMNIFCQDNSLQYENYPQLNSVSPELNCNCSNCSFIFAFVKLLRDTQVSSLRDVRRISTGGLDVHLSHHSSQCSHRVAGRPKVAHRPGRTGRGAAPLGSFALRGWPQGLDVRRLYKTGDLLMLVDDCTGF